MNTAKTLATLTANPVDNKENLKLWLCELTHLTPTEVECLVAQMEQQQVQPKEPTED